MLIDAPYASSRRLAAPIPTPNGACGLARSSSASQRSGPKRSKARCVRRLRAAASSTSPAPSCRPKNKDQIATSSKRRDDLLPIDANAAGECRPVCTGAGRGHRSTLGNYAFVSARKAPTRPPDSFTIATLTRMARWRSFRAAASEDAPLPSRPRPEERHRRRRVSRPLSSAFWIILRDAPPALLGMGRASRPKCAIRANRLAGRARTSSQSALFRANDNHHIAQTYAAKSDASADLVSCSACSA